MPDVKEIFVIVDTMTRKPINHMWAGYGTHLVSIDGRPFKWWRIDLDFSSEQWSAGDCIKPGKVVRRDVLRNTTNEQVWLMASGKKKIPTLEQALAETEARLNFLLESP